MWFQFLDQELKQLVNTLGLIATCTANGRNSRRNFDVAGCSTETKMHETMYNDTNPEKAAQPENAPKTPPTLQPDHASPGRPSPPPTILAKNRPLSKSPISAKATARSPPTARLLPPPTLGGCSRQPTPCGGVTASGIGPSAAAAPRREWGSETLAPREPPRNACSSKGKTEQKLDTGCCPEKAGEPLP